MRFSGARICSTLLITENSRQGAAHYRKFSVALRSLPQVLSSARVYYYYKPMFLLESTILINAYLMSAHLERVAHYRGFSVARCSLPHVLSRTQIYYYYKGYC